MNSFTNAVFIDMTHCVDGTRKSQWLWTWCVVPTHSHLQLSQCQRSTMKQYIFRTNSSASDPYFFNPAQKLLWETWIRHWIFKFWSKISKKVWKILDKLSFRKKKNHIWPKKKLTKNKPVKKKNLTKKKRKKKEEKSEVKKHFVRSLNKGSPLIVTVNENCYQSSKKISHIESRTIWIAFPTAEIV